MRLCLQTTLIRGLLLRYIDSGERDPTNALGSWFEIVLQDDDVSAIRWQSGFFTADGLGHLAPTLERFRSNNGTVAAIVGSNNGDTLLRDMDRLVELLGVPRTGARLGVVSFSGAFFHPKVYHFSRQDGSQAAYIGSANLTAAGVGSLHIEAGILLDTRQGDEIATLQEIADSIDRWFGTAGLPGLTIVDSPLVLAQLLATGVLAAQATPRAQNQAGAPSTSGVPRPGLQPLVRVPTWGPPTTPPSGPSAAPGSIHPSVPGGTPSTTPSAATNRPGFPSYLFFGPGANSGATVGPTALTGHQLPFGANGLVIRLNRDSARHFAGRAGTANISLPVGTLLTLQFGLFHGRFERPRAEFNVLARYLGFTTSFRVADAATGVMAYGFAPGEVGHGDIRLVLPARLCREILREALARGSAVPTEGDLALLEWPTPAHPEFRLSFLEPQSSVFGAAKTLFDRAARDGSLVGDGACWLPAGVSPAW